MVAAVVVEVLLCWSAAGLSSAAAVTKSVTDKGDDTVINCAVCDHSGFISKLKKYENIFLKFQNAI